MPTPLEGLFQALAIGERMDIRLSRSELERFQKYADAEGITVEEAVSRAVTAEMHKRYRLPVRQAAVVPFQGLKSPRSDE